MSVENVCYNPEYYGLTEVGDLELNHMPYEFYMVMALRGSDGFYLATDSGCSCPMPFESYGGVEELTGPLTLEQAKESVKILWNDANDTYLQNENEFMSEFVEFMKLLEDSAV